LLLEICWNIISDIKESIKCLKRINNKIEKASEEKTGLTEGQDRYKIQSALLSSQERKHIARNDRNKYYKQFSNIQQQQWLMEQC